MIDLDFDDSAPAKFRLRGRQPEFMAKIEADLQTYSRLLVVMPGGTGKTTLFGALCQKMWTDYGIRSLVLENRERLTQQTADRMRKETGLEVDVEMAEHHASPFAPIVCMSVQTGNKTNRLAGFAPDHFGLVVPDECHFSLAPSWLKIMRYFHYGAESLDEQWVKPADGTYIPLAKVIGFTATPDIGTKRNMGEFYQHRSVNYPYLAAIQEGWLVGIEQRSIPVKIDTSRMRTKRGTEGMEFNTTDMSAAMIPVIEELADQVLENAWDRKGIIFLPSVECSRLMADALTRRDLRAYFVSGECIDKTEKTDAFAASGVGTFLINCALYVYGIDFVDVDMIGIFSAVISKANYCQKVYRGTRVLKDIVSDDMTAEERLDAIASSPKKKLLVLDPLFVHERIDICSVYDLFTDEPEVKKKMQSLGEANPENAEKAERDFLESLRKAAKRVENKNARTIDPVAFAVAIGDDKLASYTPQEEWEAKPPAVHQLKLLEELKWPDPSKIKTAGLAQHMIGVLLMRKELALASPGQMQFLTSLGYHDEAMATWSAKKAGFLIGQGRRH